jgi:hypothetical protein
MIFLRKYFSHSFEIELIPEGLNLFIFIAFIARFFREKNQCQSYINVIQCLSMLIAIEHAILSLII